jgi:hypothetical protein
MWPADVATGLHLHHGAGENEGLLHEFDTVVGDVDVVNDSGYHNEKSRTQHVYQAGDTESGTAERELYPSYRRFETRSSDKLDWRDVTTGLVSPWSLILYNNVPFPLLCLLHAGSLLAPIAPLCAFDSYCSSHSFAIQKLGHNFRHLFPAQTLLLQ